jgi:hypothetical protein
MYFTPVPKEKMNPMTALYVAGIAAFWTLLLVVVRRKTPEEA